MHSSVETPLKSNAPACGHRNTDYRRGTMPKSLRMVTGGRSPYLYPTASDNLLTSLQMEREHVASGCDLLPSYFQRILGTLTDFPGV